MGFKIKPQPCALCRAQTDDDEYLASTIAFVLAYKRDAKGQLPRYCLHLTDVGGFLRAAAAKDARMAAIFPKGLAGIVNKIITRIFGDKGRKIAIPPDPAAAAAPAPAPATAKA